MFNHAGILILEAVPVLVCVALLLAYRSRVKARFSDRYCRVVPSSDHPVALAVLCRGAIRFGDDMTAALMRLVSMGKVRVEAIERETVTKRGKHETKRDYRLAKIEDVEDAGQEDACSQALRGIDRATEDFLFQSVARCGESNDKPWSLADHGSEESIVLSEVMSMARGCPYEFWEAYTRWGSSVKEALETRGYLTERVEPYSWAALVSFVLYLLLLATHIAFLIAGKTSSVTLLVASLLLNVLYCLACAFIYFFMRPVTEEGMELRAKLRALRNWLEDFSSLNEGVSTNAKYWNKLLVMATALGVVDRSVEQLQRVAPAVLKDPLVALCNWGGRGSGDMSCVREIRSVFDKAYGRAYTIVSSDQRRMSGRYRGRSSEHMWYTADVAR